MKLIILTLAFVSTSAFAATRCEVEATQAVTDLATQEFPGQQFYVYIPDQDDVGQERVETYTAQAIQASVVLANYTMMVDETCHVISGPTRTY